METIPITLLTVTSSIMLLLLSAAAVSTTVSFVKVHDLKVMLLLIDPNDPPSLFNEFNPSLLISCALLLVGDVVPVSVNIVICAQHFGSILSLVFNISLI